MANSDIVWINSVFDWAVIALIECAKLLGITYEEINVWLYLCRVAAGGGGYDGGDREAVEEEPNPIGELLTTGTIRMPHRAVFRLLQHRRYHENLNNLTPEDVYLGRGQAILTEREKIKRATMD